MGGAAQQYGDTCGAAADTWGKFLGWMTTRVELQCAVIHARCSPYFWMDADLRHGLMEVANIANPSGDVMSESSRGGRCGAERRGYKALLWC